MNRFSITLMAWMGLICALAASAQPVTTLYSFTKGPINPRGNLTLGPDGNLYGTTPGGGQNGDGTIFRITPDGALTTLVNFTGAYGNGALPCDRLILGPDGNLYGTTQEWGPDVTNSGTVFRMATNGVLTTLVSFNGINTNGVTGGLTLGPDGNFYGTRPYGGQYNLGLVYRVTTNGVLTKLADFNGTNGSQPWSGVTVGADGNFYGTTYIGGTSNVGTIFRMTTDGNLTTLVNFNGAGNTNDFANGSGPIGQLTAGRDGKLYGTTAYGGGNNGDSFAGTIFQITTNGIFTKLISFSDFVAADYMTYTNGSNPYGQLVESEDGNFYGTTYGGGTNGTGVVFQMTTNGTLAQIARLANVQYTLATNSQGYVYVIYTTDNWTNSFSEKVFNGSYTRLYDFPPLVNATNSIGANSQAGLAFGMDGNLYSTTLKGGAYGYGTVFRVTTNGVATELTSFSGNQGQNPVGGLAAGPDGYLYGSTRGGGVNGYGTLFKLSFDGKLTTLLNFDYFKAGANPIARLTPGPDGSFYGAANGGGTNLLEISPNNYNAVSAGTVFRITTNGVFTPLAYFNNTNGANPWGALTLAADGNFYGTTYSGGPTTNGTVFQVTTNGTLTVLTSFNGTNGANPYGRLTPGPDGNLYGTTYAGGVSNIGTVFAISPQGALNTIIHFNGTNGVNPQAGLTLGPDGNFYGTTSYGGKNNYGTVFKLTAGGALTTLAEFAYTNGAYPISDLTLGPDGNFYGTTAGGGKNDDTIYTYGTVFRVTTNGVLTAAVSFNGVNGSWPYSDSLTVVTNGHFIRLYGVTEFFTDSTGVAQNGGGTVFQVNPATSYAVPENTASLLNPLTNDLVWTTGGSLNVTGVSATNGSASISGGNLSVLPATNFIGKATVTYTVTDGTGITNVSLIYLLVTNIPPVANPDSATVGENSVGNLLNPLANDLVQTPGGTLGLVKVSATNGTAVISGTNVLFTPATNFIGTATVAYFVTDKIGGTNSSLITIQVTDASPVADPQSVVTAENTATLITLTGSAPNQLVLTYAIVTGPANGALSGFDASAGTVTYQPNADYSGPDSFTFRVSDGQADSAPATVNITVTATVATNVPPVANPDFYSVTENTTNLFNPLANDQVQTDGGILSLVSVSPTNGTATISGTNVIFIPAANFTGTATIGYVINDSLGGVSSSLITVTVTNIPPLAVSDEYGITENTTNVFEVLTNDQILTPGGTLQIIAAATTNGSVTISGGTNLVYVPEANFLGLAVIDYTITDGIGGTNSTVVTLTITNLPPVANLDFYSMAENDTNTLTPLANDLVRTPGGTLGILDITPTNGTAVISGTNIIFTPDLDFVGTASIGYTITDNVGGTNSSLITVTVTNVPQLAVDLALSLVAAPNPVDVGSPLTYSLTVTNNSDTTATGVIVSNTLSPNVTLFSLLPSQGSATNQAGVVTFAAGSLPNGASATLAIVVLPNAAGLLTNIATVSDDLPDSQPANNSVTNVTTAVSVPITNLVLTALTPMTLNPQTGLFEQTVEVANGGPSTPSSVLVEVGGLAASATLYNATGVTNGLPYVQNATPLGIGANVVFVLEFYVPTRVMPANLTYTVVAGPPFIPPVVSGDISSINRTVVLSNGNVLVEFTAIPGQVYAVQYSSDMRTWQTAVPAITAPANKVQWIDAGPPQTASSPAGQPARYYRVVRLLAK